MLKRTMRLALLPLLFYVSAADAQYPLMDNG